MSQTLPFRLFNGTLNLNKKSVNVPVGMSMLYFGTSAPPGFFICDGSAVSRTTYADLFSCIGTAFGIGDGSTTFNLPDTRGYFIRGLDDGASRDPGRSYASVQGDTSKLPNNPITATGTGSHSHIFTINASSSEGGNIPPTNGLGTDDQNLGNWGSPNTRTTFTTAGAHTHTVGPSGIAESRPINMAVNYIIKY